MFTDKLSSAPASAHSNNSSLSNADLLSGLTAATSNPPSLLDTGGVSLNSTNSSEYDERYILSLSFSSLLHHLN